MPAFEDVEVRITKTGEIYVSIEGATEEKLANYRQFLEENVGPLISHEIARKPDWDRPAGWVEGEDEKRRREQELGRR